MQIPRVLDDLNPHVKAGKVLLIYGPRQVGKTTLLNTFLSQTSLKYLLTTGEDIRVREVFESQDMGKILEFVQGYELLAIDEAQRIPHIGQGLKIIVDHVQGMRIIVTGSSSFELAGQVGEPLTGRKRTLTLYPIGQMELKTLHNNFELKQQIADLLIFGSYPEVLTAHGSKEKVKAVNEIANSYLLRGICINCHQLDQVLI